MVDGTIQKASLFGETWSAIKASKLVWGRWVAGLGLLMAVVQWFCAPRPDANSDIMKQLQQNPQLLKEHPEMASQVMHASMGSFGTLFLYLLLTVVIEAIVVYAVTVAYLRFAMAKNQPTYSVGGFFHWLGQILWKYIRPILWVLIPIVGCFFWMRSIVRYVVVSPLAILGRSPELKTSWDMTEGNWWRIFLNQMGVILFLALLVWGAALIPLIVIMAIAHGDFQSPLYRGVMCLVQGLWMGVGMMGGAIYSCTVYRVLLKEHRQTAETAVKKS